MIEVFADKYLYKLEEFCPDEVNLTLYDSNQPVEKIPEGTQAMLIRTVTKINKQNFPDLPDNLSFIGTGSAGMDHVDQDFLKQNDITFTNAAGCNARSVAEYVATALLLWADQQDVELKNKSIGIIGVGHTGSEVEKLLTKLGIETIAYDPPREKRESGFMSASKDKVLNCDILTFHVPLTQETFYPTFHWLDEKELRNRSYSLIINASRGGVVEESALIEACRERSVTNYILDVWENEPEFNDKIARHAFIKTPHIAGYSIQAKERATKMILEPLCNHFDISTPSSIKNESEITQKPAPDKFWSLTDVLTHYHPIDDYKTRFMMLIGRNSKDKINGFNDIRSNHPLRNEFACLQLPAELNEKYETLAQLGFKFD